MEKTAIKLNVNADIYEIVKDIQQNLRKKENKKTSLAVIMLRLVQKGIEFEQNEQEKGQSAQNTEHFTPESEVKGIVISSKRAKLHDELSLRQEYLNEREAKIRELEVELFDEREKLLTKKILRQQVCKLKFNLHSVRE